MQNSSINSLGNAFEVLNDPQAKTSVQPVLLPARGQEGGEPTAEPPPLPRSARAEFHVVKPVRAARRPSPPLEHQLDALIEGYADRLHDFLVDQGVGETLCAAGLLVAVLGAVFVLLCVGFVLPLPGFVSFPLAMSFLVLGLRVTLRAYARYVNEAPVVGDSEHAEQ